MAAPALNLASLNALISQCGCCELPRCCPPALECISFNGLAVGVGFLPEDSDSVSAAVPDWKRTRFLRRVHTRTGISPPDIVADHPSGTGTYVRKHTDVSWVLKTIEEYERSFEASVGSLQGGTCRSVETPLVTRCEASGGFTQTFTAVIYWGGEWVSFTDLVVVSTITEVSGQETAEHLAWEDEYASWLAAHPDYAAEHAAWESAYAVWISDYAAWDAAVEAYQAAVQAWMDGGSVGDPPVSPGDPPVAPEEPPPAPVEPDEFYPPCTYRQSFQYTYYEYQEGGPVLVESTEESPNPYEYSTVPISDLQGQDGTELVTSYEMPVTFEEFFAAAESWIDANIEEALDDFIAGGGSDSSACTPGSACGARKFSLPDVGSPFQPALQITNSRYRWKLNKCCGYKSILSGWREVFFPLAYMQWYQALAGLGSGDEIPPPPVDLEALSAQRQWQWTGTPPLCLGSSSASSEVDPYDEESMWSPWSLTLRVPTGQEGIMLLRNYFQICYGSIPDVMPGVTGQINLSDDIPDGWT